MAFSVVMPALEMAQETGKLLSWRKNEGDRVSKGEPLLEIETDKAVVEVEAPADGVLAGVKAVEGADIPVGQIIAWIVAPGEKAPTETETAAPGARVGTHTIVEPALPARAAIPSESQSASRAKISPKARRLAKELGVDFTDLQGSGPGGEILASDVEAAAAVPAKSANVEAPTSLARIMAARTTQSWTTVPHFFVSREVDATALSRYRDKFVGEVERERGIRITHTDILVAVVARVLLEHPRLNGSWAEDGIHLHNDVHMGVAIAVNDGVVAGVIRNAHAETVVQIATQRRDVAERARAGKLHPLDISGATFTISNLGMFKVDQFTAIITPPQAAILAVGAISDRVVAVERQVAVRPMMTLTLSCDHRVADGARAAMFLTAVAQALQDPAQHATL